MSEFLNMGGYAFYVWTSYAFAMVILLVNIINPRRKHKNNLLKARDFQLFNKVSSNDA